MITKVGEHITLDIVGAKKEYDHVFFGKYNSDPMLNIDEASSFKWINFKQLQLEIEENPTKFTFWLKKIVNEYSKYFINYENNNL